METRLMRFIIPLIVMQSNAIAQKIEITEWKHFKGIHSRFVWSVAFSNDNRLLASGGEDDIIKIYNIENSFEIKRLIGHNSLIRNLSFSKDNKLLYSAGQDKMINTWNVESGKLLNTIDFGVYNPQLFSQDMKFVVAEKWLSFDKKIYIFNPFTGQQLKTLSLNIQPYGLAFSPDNKIIAVGKSGGEINFYNVDSGELIMSLTTKQESDIYAITYSPDGGIFAGSSKGYLTFWSTKTWAIIAEFQPNQHAGLTCMSFSRDGKLLTTGSYDHSVKIFKININ